MQHTTFTRLGLKILSVLPTDVHFEICFSVYEESDASSPPEGDPADKPSAPPNQAIFRYVYVKVNLSLQCRNIYKYFCMV